MTDSSPDSRNRWLMGLARALFTLARAWKKLRFGRRWREPCPACGGPSTAGSLTNGMTTWHCLDCGREHDRHGNVWAVHR